MTGLKFSSNSAPLDYASWAQHYASQLETMERTGEYQPYSFSQVSQPKASLASRFITRARRFLARFVLVILLAMGLTYATCSMLAEFNYVLGWSGNDLRTMVLHLRESAKLFPLDRRFRTASASLLGNNAIQSSDPTYKIVAIPEMKYALRTDPTAADIIAMLVACDLAMGQTEEAQVYYNQFKYVAKKSPLLDMVRGSHE